jgi:lysylphosphatidylglycerol synthetase-like protein (DUF2156 family)
MSATMPPNTAAGFPSLAKKIWIFAIIRGVLAIIFGLIALFSPIATALALAIVIGAYAIVNGVFDIIEAIRHRGSSSMVLRIVLGVVSILFGILVLVWPGISLAILVIMVGIWAHHHRHPPNRVIGWTSGRSQQRMGLGHHRRRTVYPVWHPGAHLARHRRGQHHLDHRHLGHCLGHHPYRLGRPAPQGRQHHRGRCFADRLNRTLLAAERAST